MATKIEMESREENGQTIVSLAFECNKDTELDLIDAVRMAIFGNHPCRGGYATSNRLIVEINTSVVKEELST